MNKRMPRRSDRKKDVYARWILLAVVTVITAVFLIFTAAVAHRLAGRWQASQTDTTPIYTHPNLTPPTTTPATTTPIATSPVITTPIPTTPVVTTPVVTTPAVTTPVITTPVITTPVITTPAVTTPVVTTPVVTTPVVTTPVVTTPVNTTPVTPPFPTSPVVTTPVLTTPIQTTPGDTNIHGFPNWIEQRLLTNKNARPALESADGRMPAENVKYIVVHYTANPGSSAVNNRNYFNNPSANVYGSSSHFIVGLNGEIIQCIPTDEVAYANYPMNYSTISIEVCHPDATGKFNEATYNSLVRLIAWLCGEYYFDETNVIRHYDVHRLSGYTHAQAKKCPLYYVENEDAWKQLLADVATALGK